MTQYQVYALCALLAGHMITGLMSDDNNIDQHLAWIVVGFAVALLCYDPGPQWTTKIDFHDGGVSVSREMKLPEIEL